MSLKAKDNLLISVGAIAVLFTTTWAVLQQSKIVAFTAPVIAPNSGQAYEPHDLKLIMPPSENWAKVEAQPTGENWIYNVFTPPKIYYNIQSKQFTVIPPQATVGNEPSETPVLVTIKNIELVKVVQPLFRLQLIGYIGEEGSYRGTFNNEITGKTFFATSGRKVPELNLEILTFKAERSRTSVAGGSTIVEVTAFAKVKDTITGNEYNLEPSKRLSEGSPKATIKLSDGAEKVVSQGDIFSDNSINFLVGTIVQTPPSISVTKSGSSLLLPIEEIIIPKPPEAIVPDANLNGEVNGIQNPFPAESQLR